MSQTKVLVIGATGQQGGAIARALLGSKKFAVNALVRDDTSPASEALKGLGASLFKGSWDDGGAVEQAVTGCTALYLNSSPSFTDQEAEARDALNILNKAKTAGVKHVILSSAVSVDRHETLLTVPPGTFMAAYFRNKRAIQDAIRSMGFETYTILSGAGFMTNFLLPGAAFQFPELTKEGLLLTSFNANTKLPLFDPEDIGAFALAALLDPGKYSGKILNLASESLGVDEIASLMHKVSGKEVSVKYRTEEEIAAQKAVNPVSEAQVMTEKMSHWLSIEEAKAWGVPMTTFEEFLMKHKEALLRTVG